MNAKSKKLLVWALIFFLWIPAAILIVLPLLGNYLTIPIFKLLGMYLGCGFIFFVFFKIIFAPLWIAALRKKEGKKVGRRAFIQLGVFLIIGLLITLPMSIFDATTGSTGVDKLLVENYNGKAPFGDSKIKRALYWESKFRQRVRCKIERYPFFTKISEAEKFYTQEDACTNAMWESITKEFNSKTGIRLNSEGKVEFFERKQEAY